MFQMLMFFETCQIFVINIQKEHVSIADDPDFDQFLTSFWSWPLSDRKIYQVFSKPFL